MLESTPAQASTTRLPAAAKSSLPGVIRLIQSDDLAAEAVADLTAGVVMVSSALSPAARRRAVRDALDMEGWARR